MKYHQIKTKIDKVIDSCITLEQLNVAEEYCTRLIDLIEEENHSKGIWSFSWDNYCLNSYFYDRYYYKWEEIVR